MPKVFLSHSTRDRDFVEREIIALFARNHLETWYAHEDIQTSSHWERTILNGLEACDWFLVVMSPRSEASEWVKDEVDWAMEERPGRIIPVLLEECNVRRFHLRMPRIQHVDFRHDLTEARGRLLKLLVNAGNDPLDLHGEQQRQDAQWHPLYQELLAFKRGLGLENSTVGHRDASRSTSDSDRQRLDQLIAQWSHLSPIKQKSWPAFLNGLAQVQLACGQAQAALANFQLVAGFVTTVRGRADAQHNVYQTALELHNWQVALAAMKEAARDDPERWTLFPMAKYEPRQILGAGGFGVVFLCHHHHLGCPLVIKALIPEELKRGIGEVFAEASLLEELDHPVLIRVRDGDFADSIGQRPFLVLEHFNAPDLQHFVEEQGSMSIGDLLAVACLVAEALHTAHRQNILHRDVKPANVLLRREEIGWRVKLIDFGLAFRSATPSQFAGFGGTIDYSAPEQLGRITAPIGQYSDIYAFARLCCFALFKTPQPLLKHWKQTPESFAELLERCLAEAPADRPQHFGEILPDLYRLRDEMSAPTPFPISLHPRSEEQTIRSQVEVPGPPSTSKEFDAPESIAEMLPESMPGKDLKRMISQYLSEIPARQSAGQVSFRGTLASIVSTDRERKILAQLLDQYRALPEKQRRETPGLLNAAGMLELATGALKDAQRTFAEAAAESDSSQSQAEAHNNAYRAALEQGDWEYALSSLLHSCRLDPGRYDPFPLDVFRPERILCQTAWGVRFACRDRQSNLVIVTTLSTAMDHAEITRLFTEMRVLTGVDHPALLRVLSYDYTDSFSKQRPYVVQAYFDGQNLGDIVATSGVLTVTDTQLVARLLAQALQT